VLAAIGLQTQGILGSRLFNQPDNDLFGILGIFKDALERGSTAFSI
jgi:hypothetical protein